MRSFECTQSRGIWSDADFQTYLATFAFNYILCGTYLLLLLVLIFTSGPFTGKEENSKSSGAPDFRLLTAGLAMHTNEGAMKAEGPWTMNDYKCGANGKGC